MIQPHEVGDDVDLARRTLAYVRPVAPCLDGLGSDESETALSILRGIYASVAAAAPGLRSRTVGDWSWTYLSDSEMGSFVSDDDKSALRHLCGGRGVGGGGPRYAFPPADTATTRLWP